jgi:hypothetical protein
MQMGTDVIFWSCMAVFVGPIVAAVALVLLRYQFNRGTWWSWGLMLFCIYLLYHWLSGPNSPLKTPTPSPTPTARARRGAYPDIPRHSQYHGFPNTGTQNK